jgi:hypothetical protein
MSGCTGAGDNHHQRCVYKGCFLASYPATRCFFSSRGMVRFVWVIKAIAKKKNRLCPRLIGLSTSRRNVQDKYLSCLLTLGDLGSGRGPRFGIRRRKYTTLPRHNKQYSIAEMQISPLFPKSLDSPFVNILLSIRHQSLTALNIAFAKIKTGQSTCKAFQWT